MVAAYALALQVLLSGVAAGHFMAAGDASASDLFVICHGSGSNTPDNQDLPGKSQLPQSPCVLCTLTKTPSAILPSGHGIAIVAAIMVSTAVPKDDGRIIPFDSPTGQYQRGPPTTAFI